MREFKKKKCIECGRVFTPKCGTQRYCEGPHQTTCEYCGRIFEYTCSPKEKPRYCSKVCINEGKKQTVKKKYGVENVSESPEVRQKISTANSSEAVKSKRSATCLSRWGVNNISKNPEIQKKLSEVMKTRSYLLGRQKTCTERYGAAYPMQTQSVKDKRTATCLDRYGIKGHFPTEASLQKVMIDGSKVKDYLAFKADPDSYISVHYSCPPTIGQLEHDLGVTNTPIYDILIANKCSDLLSHSYSSMEGEVSELLLKLDPTIQINHNDRSVISPLEIDIYLPEYKVGIECNPGSTHNSSITDPWGQPPKHYKYHQDKSLRCEEQGIFLFHLFGYEWKNKRNILESMLKNLIQKNNTRIGARLTYVDKISHAECSRFLDCNHRQGSAVAKVRLGLRLKQTDELVSVMTFSHLRNTMGRTDDLGEDDWELARFCSKLNTNVSGGASKLFKAFIKMYEPKKIISFSDVAHARGNLYRNLGFASSEVTSPSYVWVDTYDNIYHHRVSCQKRNLRKLLHDSSIDIEKCTEKEIMESHGFVRVYDSGVIKWTYEL